MVATASTQRRVVDNETDDRAFVVSLVVAVNAAVVLLLWLKDGGLSDLAAPGAMTVAIGQITALLGTYAVLVELLLMSRIGWLERAVGFDHLAVWHRWLGFATVTLLSVHVLASTAGFAQTAHRSLAAQTVDFIEHFPDVLMAFVGFALLLAIALSSIAAARRRLRRETWYALHLYAYLAVALSFAHQLAVGTDFVDDPVARAWWIALVGLTAATILVWRVGLPVAFNLRHRLVVAEVRREAPGVVSIYITGRRLSEIDAHAGQFFLWRFLTGTGWAKAHPFSLSAKPNARFLRITVKALGDDTRALQRLRPGVRVFAEGPYGTFTLRRPAPRNMLLIAGGIGITPLRAMLEAVPSNGRDVTLLYRAEREQDLAFRGEIEAIAARRPLTVRYLTGVEIGDDQTDQLGVPSLRALVPDIAQRDVFICGPPGLVDAVLRRLHLLGTPRHQIHYERFAY